LHNNNNNNNNDAQRDVDQPDVVWEKLKKKRKNAREKKEKGKKEGDLGKFFFPTTATTTKEEQDELKIENGIKNANSREAFQFKIGRMRCASARTLRVCLVFFVEMVCEREANM
jgi:hypothetical protein